MRSRRPSAAGRRKGPEAVTEQETGYITADTLQSKVVICTLAAEVHRNCSAIRGASSAVRRVQFAPVVARRKERLRSNKISGWHHHAVRTKDMTATRAFYEGVLQLPLVGTWTEAYDVIKQTPSRTSACGFNALFSLWRECRSRAVISGRTTSSPPEASLRIL